MRRPDVGMRFFPAVLVLVRSKHSTVEMKGEEKDAEATLVHATSIQYTIS